MEQLAEKRGKNTFPSITALILICILSFASKSETLSVPVNTVFNYVFDKNETYLDKDAPMIDSAALKQYREGHISKRTALLRIETRLDILANRKEILGWVYYPETQSYDVTLRNGATFTFYFR